jgi:hypothetical protein
MLGCEDIMNEKKSFMQALLAAPPAPSSEEDFSGPVPIVPFADWDYYYITKPLQWHANTATTSGVNQVSAPVGFVTDLASIPREFWTFLSPMARYSYPAILHDHLYWFQTYTREQADAMLKTAMEELSVPSATAFAVYNAVRLGGGHAWNANTAARAGGERRVLKRFPTDVKTTWQSWKMHPDVFVT